MQELSQWEPKYPRVAAVGDYLRRVRDASLLGNLVAGDKGDLLTKIAYEEPLYSGKGETLRPDPNLLEMIPSTMPKGTIVGSILGPAGAMKLGDVELLRKIKLLRDRLLRVDPKDIHTQSTIIEDAGAVHIPHGRDYTPDILRERFGYEIPEGEVKEKMYRNLNEQGILRGVHKLGDVYDAPTIFKAHPGLKEYSVKYSPSRGAGSARITPSDKLIELGTQRDPMWLEEVMAHEVTHDVARRSNWPSGTTSTAAGSLLKQLEFPATPAEKDLAKRAADIVRAYKDPATKKMAEDSMYMSEAGEVLARAVAASHVKGGGRVMREMREGGIHPSRMYDERLYPWRAVPLPDIEK